LSFCQFLECQAPPAQTQSHPIENLATVLTSPLEFLIAPRGRYRPLWEPLIYCLTMIAN